MSNESQLKPVSDDTVGGFSPSAFVAFPIDGDRFAYIKYSAIVAVQPDYGCEKWCFLHLSDGTAVWVKAQQLAVIKQLAMLTCSQMPCLIAPTV